MLNKDKIKLPVRLIWKCGLCNDVVISYSKNRHQMDFCECGKTAVDLEEYYQRNTGKVEYVSSKMFKDGRWIKDD